MGVVSWDGGLNLRTLVLSGGGLPRLSPSRNWVWKLKELFVNRLTEPNPRGLPLIPWGRGWAAGWGGGRREEADTAPPSARGQGPKQLGEAPAVVQVLGRARVEAAEFESGYRICLRGHPLAVGRPLLNAPLPVRTPPWKQWGGNGDGAQSLLGPPQGSCRAAAWVCGHGA